MRVRSAALIATAGGILAATGVGVAHALNGGLQIGVTAASQAWGWMYLAAALATPVVALVVAILARRPRALLYGLAVTAANGAIAAAMYLLGDFAGVAIGFLAGSAAGLILTDAIDDRTARKWREARAIAIEHIEERRVAMLFERLEAAGVDDDYAYAAYDAGISDGSVIIEGWEGGIPVEYLGVM